MRPGFVLLLLIRIVVGWAQPTGMVLIRGGIYRPFLQTANQKAGIRIRSYYLDVHAVTNEEFIQFVNSNPGWKRSKVPRLFADSNYLKQWGGDLSIGNRQINNSPVTNISWFAANAYCQWKSKRLPTMNEWEYAASAPPVNTGSGTNLTQLILEWYDHPAPGVLPSVESTYMNAFGVYDMHGLVWEWVEDFNGVLPQSKQDTGSNPFVCGAGAYGASAKRDYAVYMRYAFRESLQASYAIGTLGFRCAMERNEPTIIKK